MIGRTDVGPENKAFRLKEGTRGKMYNFIVTGWKMDVVDFTNKMINVATEWPMFLTIENSVFFGNIDPWPTEAAGSAADDDMGFPDQASVEDPARLNTKVDPGLTGVNETNPSYVPTNAAAVMGKAAPTFGDTTANYAGAFKPNDPAPWTAGWTAFPAAAP
jgi:hypothetical protein